MQGSIHSTIGKIYEVKGRCKVKENRISTGFKISLSLLFIAIILAICALTGFQYTVYAATGSVASMYDETEIVDDLKGATIGGQPFNLENYGYDAEGELSLLTLVEFGHSRYSNEQQDYGIYIYVYNPRALSIQRDDIRNTINMRAGSNKETGFKIYNLEFLSETTQRGYEGLLLKYKIRFTTKQREEVLAAVYRKAEREYYVGDLNLLMRDQINATTVPVGKSFYFSGYAAGYDDAKESTLQSYTEEKEVISLNVTPTQFQPKGYNGKNAFMKDVLHSVYFAVPNQYLRIYGDMTKVHARWLNAITAPALVTGNWQIYEALKPYLGVKMSEHVDELKYLILGNLNWEYWSINFGAGAGYGYSYLGNNAHSDIQTDVWTTGGIHKNSYGEEIDALQLLFYAGVGEESAHDYTIVAEAIQDELLARTAKLGGELVQGKYSRALFSQVDEEFTEVNWAADKEWNLANITLENVYNSSFFGLVKTPSKYKKEVSETPFSRIKAIHEVEEKDLKGSDDDISQALYVDKGNVEELKKFYEDATKITPENPEGCSVFLFRYQVSDYIAQQAAECYLDQYGWCKNMVYLQDYNAYFFQETVNLDFRVIDLTFSRGMQETVIPVAQSPIDVFHDATFPTYKEPKGGLPWWAVLLIILVVIIVVYLLYRLLDAYFKRLAGGKKR